jgi:hypothetical protein
MYICSVNRSDFVIKFKNDFHKIRAEKLLQNKELFCQKIKAFSFERKDINLEQKQIHVCFESLDDNNLKIEDLKNVFDQYGNVESIVKASEKYAFVKFSSAKSAKRVLENGENIRLENGKRLKVNPYKSSKSDYNLNSENYSKKLHLEFKTDSSLNCKRKFGDDLSNNFFIQNKKPRN